MDDGYVRRTSKSQRQRPQKTGWLGVVEKVKREFHERKTRKKIESPSDRTARLTANATHAIAWLTGILAIIATLQLYELIEGGADTKAIAEAAKQQACAAKNFAASAANINIGVANAVVRVGQQADDAETFFRTNERAWVEIDRVELVDTIPANPPFGIIYKFGFHLKNVGKTVARNVQIHIDDVNADTSFDSDRTDIRRYQNRLWHEQETGKRIKFPNSPSPQTLDPESTNPVPIYGGGQEPMHHGDIFRYSFMVGRIDYTDAFNTPHWVNFCFMIMQKGELGHCEHGNEEDNTSENLRTSTSREPQLGLSEPTPYVPCPTPEKPREQLFLRVWHAISAN